MFWGITSETTKSLIQLRRCKFYLPITAGLSLASAKNNIPDADCDSFAECTSEISVEGGFEFEGQEFCLENKPGLGVEVEEF